MLRIRGAVRHRIRGEPSNRVLAHLIEHEKEQIAENT
jgi:hypothetical protein